jgi:FkbM family methyltransferase
MIQHLMSRALAAIPFSFRDRIKTIPGVAHLQRAIVASTLDGREFEHRVDAGPAQGITFLVRMPEDKGIWTGTYETDFATRLAASVTPGAAAYDIGSWHGFFAGVMAAQGASHVHAFEPLPANAEQIRRLIALNPGRAITLHSCALGDRETEMDLMIMPETSMAKLEASSFQVGETGMERVRVKVRSIDTMIAAGEIAPPALMKIDVEGAESMVLAGARETIRRHRPVIFVEAHSASLLEQCGQFFRAEDYDIELIDVNPAVARAKDVYQFKATPHTMDRT